MNFIESNNYIANDPIILFGKYKESKFDHVRQALKNLKHQASDEYLYKRGCLIFVPSTTPNKRIMPKKRQSIISQISIESKVSKKASYCNDIKESNPLIKGFDSRKQESISDFDKMINQGFTTSSNEPPCYTLKITLTPPIAKNICDFSL
ncbi:hypothetical protein K502DRAFT_324693 [Neoconidiobolus thromboides FSU 785]|nr:hypothetical protein K502DRAFT_324693 [Neoconidiobolus thromboides FSU 785]